MSIPQAISFGSVVGDEIDDSGNFVSGPVPFRTIVMLISLFSHLLISSLTNFLFMSKKIRMDLDILNVFEIK